MLQMIIIVTSFFVEMKNHDEFKEEDEDVKNINSHCTSDGSWMRWDDTQIITHITWKHRTIPWYTKWSLCLKYIQCCQCSTLVVVMKRLNKSAQE